MDFPAEELVESNAISTVLGRQLSQNVIGCKIFVLTKHAESLKAPLVDVGRVETTFVESK